MRFTTLSRSTSVLALAVAALVTAPASAQTAEAPPGAPQSSQQDDTADSSPQDGSDTAATAAETAGPLETGDGQSEVVVTGSRIARPEFAFPNPIQAYTAENLEQSGETNITEFLTDSPALLGSTGNQDVAGSSLTNSYLAGVNLLDLRNLGENRTLVLVDGRRHVAAAPGLAAVDTNTIPVDLIDRIDVLTGGTSAVYGADGVSGVVNFVLKRDFSGLRVRGQSGISERGDAGERFFAVTAGQNFADNRANVSLAYEYNETDRFRQVDRLNYGRSFPSTRFVLNGDDIADGDDINVPDNVPRTDLRWLDTSPGGAIDLDFDFSPDRTGEGGLYDRGVVLPGTPFAIGGDSTPQEIYFGDFTPYTRKHIVNLLGHYELSDALRVFAELKHVRNKGFTESQPSYDFFTELFPDNLFLQQRFGSDAEDGALITGRDNFDFGIRGATSNRETTRGVLGIDGRFGQGLRYDLSYVWGEAKVRSISSNDRYLDRYFAAIDVVAGPNGQPTCRINLPGETQVRSFTANSRAFGTYDGSLGNFGLYVGVPVSFRPGECVPLNLLGNGAPSQAALDFILYDARDSARIRQQVLSGNVSGTFERFFSLPGGPIGFALGAEYRRENSRYDPDPVQAMDQLESAATAQTVGSFDVREAYGELNLPIFSKAPFAETLSVGGAIRFSDYSTIGRATTWSVNGVYAPVRDISLRGTLSQAVRAPNISELFDPPAGTFAFVDDPCGPENIDQGSATRAANCLLALQQAGLTADEIAAFDPAFDPTSPGNSSIPGRQGGNPGLQEETARTWTAGLVLRPRFVPGLQVAFDWYDISIRDAVNTPSVSRLVELCVDQPTLDNPFCANLSRDPESGYVDDFLVSPSNVASFDTEGLDLALNYRFRPSRLGSFNLRVTGNYLHKLEFIASPGAEVDDARGVSFERSPDYSATGDLTWTSGALTLNYGLNWFDKTLRYSNRETEAEPDIVADEFRLVKARFEHEIQAALDVDQRFNLYAGVNNLFDEKPDVGSSGFPVSARGRFLYVGFKAMIR